uniref:Uncharacterized protein n=1 Tax=Panagrolaimus sp. JU765 TaxID=591449 RepID=A0AC34QJW4_9BILA
MVRQIFTALIWLFCLATVFATPLVYRPYYPKHFEDEQVLMKRSNAELINGLIGMDLNRLSAMGKRSNAELINGLLGMNLNKLSSAGKR